MANKVTLTLNGRVYTVACDDGEEKRVQYLAQYIDQKLREVARTAGPAANESYQWVLTSLMLADELLSARETIDTAQMDNKQGDVKAKRQAEIDVEAVQHLTHRIEELAEQLKATA
jgi:cell division protein ZapA